MKQRITWIDYAKSLAIFCVVFVHTYSDLNICMALHTITMPTFFFLSGYLFSYERNPDYGKFLVKRFRQLIIPYFWIGALAYVCWYFVLRHFGSNTHDTLEWYTPLVGTFAGIPPLLAHDIPLWSLVTFFVVEAVYYPLQKLITKKWVVPIAAFALTVIAYYTIPAPILSHLPFAIAPSLISLFFYSVGHQFAQTQGLYRKCVNICGFIVAIVVFYFALNANGDASYYICNYNNVFLYTAGALAGILAILCITKALARLGDYKFIQYISQTTLIICGFHLLIFAALKGVALFVFHIEPEALTDGALRGFILSVVTIFLTVPISYVIRRYARFLIDK